MEALAVRSRARGEDERCPYCHDLVSPGDEPAAMVTCPDCATAHHAECVAELGRCTVLGCERPLQAPAGLARDSYVGREVRRRLGDRARDFVARNAKVVPPDPYGPRLLAARREEPSSTRDDAGWSDDDDALQDAAPGPAMRRDAPRISAATENLVLVLASVMVLAVVVLGLMLVALLR